MAKCPGRTLARLSPLAGTLAPATMLGLEQLVAFEKHCANYRFAAMGRDMLATMVTVPEIDGVFIELEALADEAGLADALGDVRTVLGE